MQQLRCETCRSATLARILRWILMIVVSTLIGTALGFGIWYYMTFHK